MDGEGLISQNVLDDYWEMATSEMLSVLRAHCVCHTCMYVHLYISYMYMWAVNCREINKTTFFLQVYRA